MSIRIINADVLDGLRGLPDESVHCVVTSPPYYGLRDYGTATWEGGDAGCDHVSHEIRTGKGMAALGEKYRGGGHKAGSDEKTVQFRDLCGKCGARRIDQQIGLEATPEAFIARLVEVFREVRRVLRKDGTCWVNMGDSYATGTNADRKATTIEGTQVPAGWSNRSQPVRRHVQGLKPKDLLGIPWMLAFALRADGWWLRSDIIWHKPNPMPESVTDRPTKSHEYLFLLTKAERYFYDAEAIKEALATDPRENYPARAKITGRGEQGFAAARGADRDKSGGFPIAGDTRNKRSVWTIATAPFAEAHFATFPPELPEICIKAGCPKGGTVLDPFAGAGTTLMVADRLQRNGIGIELNPTYAAMAERRINGDRGGLLDIMEAAQ